MKIRYATKKLTHAMEHKMPVSFRYNDKLRTGLVERMFVGPNGPLVTIDTVEHGMRSFTLEKIEGKIVQAINPNL